MGKTKKATEEQIRQINNALQETGLANTWEDFASEILTEKGREKFSINLMKQLKATNNLSSQMSHDGSYQPMLSEALLQELDAVPIDATSTEIEQWLRNPQYYSNELTSVNKYLSQAVGVYRRALWYMNTIKAFNYTLNPSDVDVQTALKLDKNSYMSSYHKALEVTKKLNIKYQIPKIDLSTMYDGASFWWISETNDNITFLPLPSKYCYITSPFTFGYRFAFDLTFFDSFVGMKDAIPELWEAYDYFNEMRKAYLQGDAKYDGELTAMQYYSVPIDKGWVFTFDPIHPDRTPPMASSMGSAIDVLSYRSLLKNQLALNLFKIIPLKMPIDKQTGKPTMTYEVASMIVTAIKSVLPENIVPFASPFDSESIQTDQTNKFEDIIKLSNDNFYSSAGMAQGIFGSNDIKQGTALQFSSMVDFAYASTHMYSQFENCINWILWRKTGQYKFKVKFFGNKLTNTKDTEAYSALVRTANMPASKLFAYEGYEPFEVVSTLVLEKELGIKDLMTPLISAFNSSSTDEGGRPEKSDLTDGGENTRDYETNED